ncbi:MmcQ/YjbR family DNA-binding protein [Microbacterium sp. NPDC091313]
MTHPVMFDDRDPLLARVRAIALRFPGAAERVSHGRPNFHTDRTFCYFGGSERIDGAWVAHDRALLVRPDPGDAPALAQDPRFFRPAYLGPSGWLGVDLDDRLAWDEAAELIDASYRVTAPARLVRELDALAGDAS